MVRVVDLGLRVGRGSGSPRLEDMSLEDVEACLIKKALARFSGNVSHAANALGLSRSALYRRLADDTGCSVLRRQRAKPAMIGHEGRVLLLALLAGLPGSTVVVWMLWRG